MSVRRAGSVDFADKVAGKKAPDGFSFLRTANPPKDWTYIPQGNGAVVDLSFRCAGTDFARPCIVLFAWFNPNEAYVFHMDNEVPEDQMGGTADLTTLVRQKMQTCMAAWAIDQAFEKRYFLCAGEDVILSAGVMPAIREVLGSAHFTEMQPWETTSALRLGTGFIMQMTGRENPPKPMLLRLNDKTAEQGWNAQQVLGGNWRLSHGPHGLQFI